MHKRRAQMLGLLALFAIAFALVIAGCGSGGSSAPEPADSGSCAPATTTAEGDYSTGIHHARIVVRDYGTIEVELNERGALPKFIVLPLGEQEQPLRDAHLAGGVGMGHGRDAVLLAEEAEELLFEHLGLRRLRRGGGSGLCSS